MLKLYQQTKVQFHKQKDWIMKNPKESYKYVMVLLLLSFAFSFVQYFFFTPKVAKSFIVPELYSKSDEVVRDNDKKDQKREEIVEELKELKYKREKEHLTKTDSLRIEYLFNQYQNLKNGH